MKFDLTHPCKECPFRKDVEPYIRTERAQEIANVLLEEQKTFSCHKYTNSLGHEGEEQHCAGATILLEKHDRPNQWMRISERLGLYDRTKLKMDSPVYSSFFEFIGDVASYNGDI